MRLSYSARSRRQPSQNGAGSSPRSARLEDVEVGVPAGADAEQRRAVGQAAVGEGEQHLGPCGSSSIVTSALPFQVKARRRGGSSSVMRDSASGARSAEAVRALARRVGELVVAPDELEGRADRQRHLARGQPAAAQVALGEVGPDPLDRAGQQALDAQRSPARSGRRRRRWSQCHVIVVSFLGRVRGFASSLLAQQAFEVVEAVGPEALVEAEPLVRAAPAGRGRGGRHGCASGSRGGSGRRSPAP